MAKRQKLTVYLSGQEMPSIEEEFENFPMAQRLLREALSERSDYPVKVLEMDSFVEYDVMDTDGNKIGNAVIEDV